MTELETQILTLVQKLNSKEKQTAVNMIQLMICCPDFSDAMREATPADAIAPPWEVTEQLVAEWMAKEGALRG